MQQIPKKSSTTMLVPQHFLLGDFELTCDLIKAIFVFGFNPSFLLGDFELTCDLIKAIFVFDFKPSFLLGVLEQIFDHWSGQLLV